MIARLNKTGSKSSTFREKAKSFLTGHFFILETILITTFIMAWIGGPGYLLGLLVALITLWSTKWDWSFFGLGNVDWAASIIPAVGYVMLIILINDFMIEPIVELSVGENVQIQSFDDIRGNITNLIIMLVTMWVIAAFGEELFFRGYVMNRLTIMFGNKQISCIIALIISSIIFGIAHGYQGISGMITTGIVGLFLGLSFYQYRNNLFVAILVHGIYDTYGLILIYSGNEMVIKNLMKEIFTSIIN